MGVGLATVHPIPTLTLPLKGRETISRPVLNIALMKTRTSRTVVRRRSIQACRLLSDIAGELLAGTRAPLAFEQTMTFHPRLARIMLRMCFSHLIVTLAKWPDFCRRYRPLIPRDCREACEELTKTLKAKRVEEFRDCTVGRIWHQRGNTALTSDELDRRIEQITDASPEAFLSWLNNHHHNRFPETVVSIVEHLLDRIKDEHDLSDTDIFPEEGNP